jgi:anti-anti-sigma factor
MSDQTILRTELKRCDLFKLSGRFDTSSAQEVANEFQNAMNLGRFRFVLDMTDTEYISSGFLRVLVGTQKTVKRFNRGDIYLAGLSARLQDVMDLAGLTVLFEIFDAPEEAVGAW